jgi:SAM-dependent methyltransferase
MAAPVNRASRRTVRTSTSSPIALITGERVVAPLAGFNPAYQRHVAEYRMCGGLLPDGPVLDLGCGTGHSYRELAPRTTVGVDTDPAVLVGQERETHVADMRVLPFADGTFASAVAIQSLEHVPDPERVLDEVVRVLREGGRAIFTTPNRLTFGRANEIIDPYHFVEYDAGQLEALCRQYFASVEIRGVQASERYLAIHGAERRRLERMLRLDPLRLRRHVPRRMRQRLYDWRLRSDRVHPRPGALEIEPDDFSLTRDGLAEAIDLFAICGLRP